MSKTNVIDLRPRLKKQAKTVKHENNARADVIEITQLRHEMITKEKRQKKRTILTEFIGAFIILPQMGVNQRGGLQKVLIHDISEDGLSFDLEIEVGTLREGEEVAMRLYLSQKDYFPFMAKITNTRFLSDEGIYRHGCSFVKGSVNREALHHFVKFIENVSLDVRIDSGDMLTSSSKK